MIEFNCQHCGKRLHLRDSYAGRDGWCRVCKRMVIVPDGSAVVRVEDLPPEQGYPRLQRLLQYAATKADQYRLECSRQSQEVQIRAELEAELAAARESLVEQVAQYEQLETRFEAVSNSMRASDQRVAELESALKQAQDSAPEALDSGREELELALAAERESRTRLESLLSEQEVRAQAAETECQALQERLCEADAETEGRVRELTAELASARSELEAAAADREHLSKSLEEFAAGGQDNAALLVEREKEISALQADLARARAECETVEQEAGERARALEAETARLDEARARADVFQGQVQALEKAHLDDSLALEQSRQEMALAKHKMAALETSAREAAEASADQAVALEHLKRDLAGRDEQVKKLTEELGALASEQTAASLEHDKLTRAMRAAENRAGKLASELTGYQTAQETLQGENQAASRNIAGLHARISDLETSLASAQAGARRAGELARSVQELEDKNAVLTREMQAAERSAATGQEGLAATTAGLETEIQSLRTSLEQARQNAADAEARAGTATAAEAELASLRKELEEMRTRAATERKSLNDYATELQAEIMNLTLALDSAQATAAAGATGEEGVEATSARELAVLRAENASLKEALSEFQLGGPMAGDGALDSGSEEEGVIVLEAHEAGDTVSGLSGADAAKSRQRQLDKKQMMDALSDFLNK